MTRLATASFMSSENSFDFNECSVTLTALGIKRRHPIILEPNHIGRKNETPHPSIDISLYHYLHVLDRENSPNIFF